MEETIHDLARAVREAAGAKRPLWIRGGGTKDFYGGEPRGDLLDTRRCAGIVSYEPTELVLTARAGTLLSDIESALAECGQLLPFEPPHFGPAATLGGCVAAGLSGPRRPYAGAVRDLILGVRILDGHGRALRFGGEVMKNVAGYDVSRLMAGALGTLGVLVEVSLKVLPRPPAETTLRLEIAAPQAIEAMNRWAGEPLPITATCHEEKVAYVRLAGSEGGVHAARQRIGGETVPDGAAFWQRLREQALPFFDAAAPLWRVSVKSTTAPLALPGRELVEWSGALRWVLTDADAATVRAAAASAGGHATLFRRGEKHAGVFHPLAPALLKIHRRLKAALDPHGILNPGRLYPEVP